MLEIKGTHKQYICLLFNMILVYNELVNSRFPNYSVLKLSGANDGQHEYRLQLASLKCKGN